MGSNNVDFSGGRVVDAAFRGQAAGALENIASYNAFVRYVGHNLLP
jgi:hypothetical protein